MSATCSVETKTVTEEGEKSPSVSLKLKKPKAKKGVNWKEGVIDNEHMNKKKSKCCCIYEKRRMFGESSSSSEADSDDECKMCRKQKKGNYQPQDSDHSHDAPTENGSSLTQD